jgi:hypothetical protein
MQNTEPKINALPLLALAKTLSVADTGPKRGL